MDIDEIKGIPYGISNFEDLRANNFYYVDKTMFLPTLERAANFLFLIRPRRFGKSMFLSMMSAYYDIEKADRFDSLFDGLWIKEYPTKDKNSYQVLYFDFSKAGFSVSGQDMMASFNAYCSIVINKFAEKYASYYKPAFVEEIKNIPTAKDKLSYIAEEAKDTNYQLYLIVDEYDNFTNVIFSQNGSDALKLLTHASGFYREYFKVFKAMFSRILMLGVSPITLNELTSGYNIAMNISNDERFNAMLGFSETDVRHMIAYYQHHGLMNNDLEAMIADMKPWYDNYCFAEECLKAPRMFNCDMTLYYLNNQLEFNRAPKEMADVNIRTDYTKLKMLVKMDKQSDRLSVIQEIADKGYIDMRLVTSFPSEEIANGDNFQSLLYYYGMLTITGVYRGRIRMGIPNNCVREQYYQYLLKYFDERKMMDMKRYSDLMVAFAYDGEWQETLTFLAEKYKENSSVRDAIEGEHNISGFFKAYFSIMDYYLLCPEVEMNKGYCDFLLLPNKQRFDDVEHSYIIELKYSKKDAPESEIQAKYDEAVAQLHRYSEDKLARQLAEGTTLHLIVLQFRGAELLKCEEINMAYQSR
jgi:hypothetical protein